MGEQSFWKLPFHPSESTRAIFLQIGRIFQETFDVFGRHVAFIFYKVNAFITPRKIREKEGFDFLSKKVLLSPLAILVHTGPERLKIYAGLLDKQIIFVVAVGVHEGGHAVHNPVFGNKVEIL